MPRPLLVKVTCGADDPERSNQAFTVAGAAVAAGAEVSLWLTGDAVWAAVPARGLDLGLEHATPVAALLEVVLGGGSVTVCTQCATRRGITQADVAEGVRIAGAAVFAEEALRDGVQALVY
ncbi:DsrE family protein [Nocardioides sp. zg-DK7169]|uniref:DsrE family protein n=1 Tax=Nocardioides sp. zg-DK7169 TaxID=2736600 RepID=UPI001552D588|nr:DsrE family protein [Nocardioides sp. zg-DK7169]NPC97252.1 DsrE family protein [Nocardioides sp. zg-DK7169]